MFVSRGGEIKMIKVRGVAAVSALAGLSGDDLADVCVQCS